MFMRLSAVFLWCLTAESWGLLPNQKGVLTPRPTFVEANRAVMARCRVNSSLSVSQVFFTLGDVRVDDYLIQHRTRWEAVLTHPGFPVEPPAPWLCCNAVMTTGDNMEITCHQYHVDVKAYKPSISSVELVNWECLRVAWTRQPNMNLPTVVKAEIRPPLETQFRECPTWSPNSCRYCGEFDMDSYFVTVRVVASNSFGNESAESTVRLSDIVRVGHVKNFTASALNSSLQLVWRSPRAGWDIKYMGTATCPYQSDPENFVLLTSANQPNYVIEHPWAHCLYTATVRACPVRVGGHCSDRSNVTVRAKAAVPSALPGVIAGGFSIDDDSLVTVFWQPIPEKLHYGNHLTYCITICADESCETRRDIGPQNFTLTFRKLSSSEHLVCVTAENEIGTNTSLLLNCIKIPENRTSPDLPTNVTALAISDGSVRLTWDQGDVADGDVTKGSSATVYHCAGNIAQGLCKEQLWWNNVGYNSSSATIHVPQGSSVYNYRFGISRQTFDYSTGIRWVACVYDSNKLAPRPRAWLVSTDKTQVMLRIEEPPCGNGQGYTGFFEIRWKSLGEKEDSGSIDVPTGQRQTSITNLIPGQKYQFGIQAVNFAGVSQSLTIQGDTKPPGLHVGWIVILGLVGVGGVFALLFLVVRAHRITECVVRNGKTSCCPPYVEIPQNLNGKVAAGSTHLEDVGQYMELENTNANETVPSERAESIEEFNMEDSLTSCGSTVQSGMQIATSSDTYHGGQDIDLENTNSDETRSSHDGYYGGRLRDTLYEPETPDISDESAQNITEFVQIHDQNSA